MSSQRQALPVSRHLPAWGLAALSLTCSLGAQAVTVSLGSAAGFAVLAAATVTNTGPSSVLGDMGVSPGTALTGLGSVALAGTVHSNDAVSLQAQADAALAFQALAALPACTLLTGQDLGGMTLAPGTYTFASSAQLSGLLTLDAMSDPQASFVFRIGSTLTTASLSAVTVLNGNASQVFWQVGSSATLGTGTAFAGSMLAAQSITLTTGCSILCGRAVALDGAVTMDTNQLSTFCPSVGVIPEPASAWLLTMGLLAVAGAWQAFRPPATGLAAA